MALLCDACGTKFNRDDGNSSLHVTPPRVDFKTLQAFASAGQTCTYPEARTLDVCRTCTIKILELLGIPTTICTLLEPPTTPDPIHVPPPGLSTDDLRKLRDEGALSDDDLRSLGIEPRETAR